MINFRSNGKLAIKVSRKTPKVLIEPKALAKLGAYVDKCELEIGGLGKVEMLDPDTFLITDVYLIKQEVSSASTDLDEEGMHDFLMGLIEANDLDTANKIKFWWHSHVNMGTSPSGTDNNTMDDFAKDNDYFIRGIFNKKGEVNMAAYMYKENLIYENMDWGVYYPDTEMTPEAIEKEIEEKVTEKTFTTYPRKDYTNHSSKGSTDYEGRDGVRYGEYGYWKGGKFYSYYEDDDDFYGSRAGFQTPKNEDKKEKNYRLIEPNSKNNKKSTAKK